MVLLLVFLMFFQQLYPPEFWREAERKIRRVPPSAFPKLPANVRSALVKRGCTIPQTPFSTRNQPENIVRGNFAAPGQVDWAALCSDGKRSRIIVVWGGPAQCASELAEMDDFVFIELTGEGKVDYSRALSTTSAKQIREAAPAHDVSPPPLNHDGIDDAFLEKASTTHYCYRGEWLHMPFSD
jgi:hypothetical protein